jgi:Uncharacterized conserved protein (DUF2190)
MAVRKPLVIIGTVVTQLPAGDSISVPITGAIEIVQTNDEAGAIVIGTPVYNDAAGGVKKAKADAIGTTKVMGLVSDASIAGSGTGQIAVSGILTATTGQWDAVFGTSGGLTFGTVYCLSAATAGLGTSTAPSTTGQYVERLGIALSTVDFKIDIGPLIAL